MSETSANLRRSTRIIARVRETSDSEDSQSPLKNKRVLKQKPAKLNEDRYSRLAVIVKKNGQSKPTDKQSSEYCNLVACTRSQILVHKSKRTFHRRRLRSNSSVDDEPTPSHLDKPELERELENIEENVERPKELFDEEDVSANRYCGFQTPSKKTSMVEKAILCRTQTLHRSPEKLPVLKIIVERSEISSLKETNKGKQTKNGTSVRRRKIISDMTSSESESVSEDSEFIPSNDDSSSDDKEISEHDDNYSEEEDDRRPSQTKKIQFPTTPSTRRGKSNKSIAYSDFHLKTDDYFESQSDKIVTSDRTLARLKNPRLNEKKLQELLENQSHVSRTHTKAICKLTENYKNLFPMWYHIMEEGYSLLLHGVGSKRNLINDFHNEIIADHPTLIVNGFFPSLSVKDILDSIITELLELDSPTNLNEAFNLIEENLRKNPDDRLYLLIHNIDGAILRSNKSQDTLSRLAAISNVRLLASVDHINAPLSKNELSVWDNVKRSRYNFYWWDATTLLPYEAETSYESSLLVQHSGALALSSLHNVFQSLTANTKAIYILLVKHQLENGKSHNYSGMAFKDLYRGAREGFLVSSDLALRAQLTEFIDHKLVKTKRNVDGAEYLAIPLDNALLQKFLDQQDEP